MTYVIRSNSDKTKFVDCVNTFSQVEGTKHCNVQFTSDLDEAAQFNSVEECYDFIKSYDDHENAVSISTHVVSLSELGWEEETEEEVETQVIKYSYTLYSKHDDMENKFISEISHEFGGMTSVKFADNTHEAIRWLTVDHYERFIALSDFDHSIRDDYKLIDLNSEDWEYKPRPYVLKLDNNQNSFLESTDEPYSNGIEREYIYHNTTQDVSKAKKFENKYDALEYLSFYKQYDGGNVQFVPVAFQSISINVHEEPPKFETQGNVETNYNQDIELQVIGDIINRQKLGIDKYGTTLANNPLKLEEWLIHAYEESLDYSLYLKRAIQEIQNNEGLK